MTTTLRMNFHTLYTIINYLDANLKAYYNTNIIDAIDNPEFSSMGKMAISKIKMMIRLIKDKVCKEFVGKQLLVYTFLFQYIHRVIVDIKDDLIEELSAVSEVGFEKEQAGEINTQQFIRQQNIFKDIHKIITLISSIPLRGQREFNFAKVEENMVLMVEY
jgi:hypothetical protein